MHNELTLAVLLYIKKHILKTKRNFTTGNHFIDKSGKALPPEASSIPRVAQRCIGGAVIEALVELGIEENASSKSRKYHVVMYNLGDSLGDDFKSGTAKIEAIMRVNNEQGFEAVRDLIDITAERLFRK